MSTFGYSATTKEVQVQVEPFYLEDESRPDDSMYVWGYRIQITNRKAVAIQLLGRTWIITDATGRTIEVEGAGVVGEQPHLEPGDSFEYTSGTPLETETGFMRGIYHMIVVATAEPFDVLIPTFSLDSPYSRTKLH